MQQFKNLIFLVFVMLLAFGSSLTSFAITPYSDMVFENFESGPWTDNKAACKLVDTDGANGSANTSIPGWKSSMSSYRKTFTTDSPTGRDSIDFYTFNSDQNANNIVVMSDDPLVEMYAVDQYGNLAFNILDDAFLAEVDGAYIYCASVYYLMGIGFRAASNFEITEISSGLNASVTYDQVINNLPYLGGIYNSSSTAIRYPGLAWHNAVSPLSENFGFDYAVFPLVIDRSEFGLLEKILRFTGAEGVLHANSDYQLNFKVWYVPDGHAFINDDMYDASVSGNYLTFNVPGQDVPLNNLYVSFVAGSSATDCYAFKYLSSSSDDVGVIPPDDDGGGGGSSESPDYSAAIGQIGSTLKELLSSQDSSTTTIVNNITNATTTISNTITNTTQQITNTITNGVSSITNSLQSVEQGISNKLGEVQEGLSNKLQEVKDDINTQLKDTTDEIVNGFDNSVMESEANKLDTSISQYDEAEQSVIQNVNDSLDNFEFDAELGEYQSIVSVISDFLQALYDSSGGFKVLINLSMLLSLAGIVIGIYRFGGGS